VCNFFLCVSPALCLPLSPPHPLSLSPPLSLCLPPSLSVSPSLSLSLSPSQVFMMSLTVYHAHSPTPARRFTASVRPVPVGVYSPCLSFPGRAATGTGPTPPMSLPCVCWTFAPRGCSCAVRGWQPPRTTGLARPPGGQRPLSGQSRQVSPQCGAPSALTLPTVRRSLSTDPPPSAALPQH